MRISAWPRRIAGLALSVALAACAGAVSAQEEAVPLRLGYFPNITHAPAILGVEQGLIADALGAAAALEPVTFGAGPAAVEALFSAAVDAAYIGTNPAINAYVRSGGQAVRLLAGSTSGGAFLVVRPGITGPQELRGARLATPQLGNTQDVALRAWLAEQGLRADPAGGGDVAILPQPNAQTLETFAAGDVDGAWVPEPWATRLLREAGGRVLVDERDLWPGGRYATTHLVVRTAYLEQHPDVVAALLEGHVAAVDALNADPRAAQETVNNAIERVTGQRLGDDLIAAAWENLEFTVDPVASSLVEGARDAAAVGLLEPVDLDGIYALDPLNRVLSAAGRDPVEGL